MPSTTLGKTTTEREKEQLKMIYDSAMFSFTQKPLLTPPKPKMKEKEKDKHFFFFSVVSVGVHVCAYMFLRVLREIFSMVY